MNPSAMSFLPTVDVFDANVRIGEPRDGLSISPDAPALLKEMDDRGVSQALVLHEYADTMGSCEGQAMLDRALAASPRLIPQTCILPTDDGLQLLKDLHFRGALRSARLSYDARQKLLFTPDFYGAICAFLQDNMIPLFVPAEGIDLRDLPTLARAFPRLPLVLVEAHYTLYLWIKPLMRAVPTLHLELSRYEAFDQVNELAGEFGASRLIYGSAYPRYAMGPVLFYLHTCGLSQNDLKLICGGNLHRLLGRTGAA